MTTADKRRYQHEWYLKNKDTLKRRLQSRLSNTKWRTIHKEKAKADSKKWHERHPDYDKQEAFKSRLRREYGLTVNDYELMLKAQHGVCAICERPSIGRRLSVDHEHIKGFKDFRVEDKKKYVRGLLCFQCNKYLIGRRKRIDAALFDRAAQYLRREKAEGLN